MKSSLRKDATFSLFHFRFKTVLFHRSFPQWFFYLSTHRTHSTDSSCFSFFSGMLLVANRPEFFRIVRNFLVLSGKKRLTFPDSGYCNVRKKVVIVTVCSVISSIILFILFKQTVLSHCPKFKGDYILSQIWLLRRHTRAAAFKSVR